MERSQTSSKRKHPFSGLQRRVRARKEDPEPALQDEYNGQTTTDREDGGDSEAASAEDTQSEITDSDDDGDDNAEKPQHATSAAASASQISFGALAKAQASLPSGRKGRGHHKPDTAGHSESDDDSSPEQIDSRGRPNKEQKQIPSRANKHAPSEMTSKKPVTRRRQVIELHRPQPRDPRFGPGPASQHQSRGQSEEAARHNYAFLSAYRDTEMAELKSAIRAEKRKKNGGDAARLEEMQRALASMRSRREAEERKEAARAVVQEHRRKEKELVGQGKKPFYLKRSEQKQRVLVDRFKGLKKGQVDKAIQRRRKKDASREKRELPLERRAR